MVSVLDIGRHVNSFYTHYLTVTGQDELLLPCLPLTFELGDLPGYAYGEPVVRYGVHSQELFSRAVVFHGTPRPDALVVQYDAGSVYVNAGSDPVPLGEHLAADVPYAARAPAPSQLTYQDIWSRTQAMTVRASFYDVWDWDSCATCGDPGDPEQHAGTGVTFGLWADLDGNGTYETRVPEIPTRLPGTRLVLLGKTYRAGTGGTEAHGAVVRMAHACKSGPANAEGGCDILPGQPAKVVLDVTMSNEGDAIARDVLAAQALPDAIVPVKANPPWAYAGPGQVAWNLGDLAPGAKRSARIVLWVAPLGEGKKSQEIALPDPASESPPADVLPVEQDSEGAFLDSGSHLQRDDSNIGMEELGGDPLSPDAHSLVWMVYLPLIQQGHGGP